MYRIGRESKSTTKILTYCTIGDFNAVWVNSRPLSAKHHVENSVKTPLVVARSEPVGPLHKRPNVRNTVQLTAQQD